MRAVILFLAACGGSSHTLVMSTHDAADYPFVLRDPHTITHDFSVRQNLKINAKRDGKPVDGELDAVLQKQGDTLLIVGFGPMNVKAFTLSQKGDRIEFTQFMGPQLPFSPRNVVVDVQRVFFKRLPPPAGSDVAHFSGEVHGELDGETLDETWTDGQLRTLVATRPNTKLKGAIRIELGPGCADALCEPESATLKNEWFDYTLAITNEDYQAL